eukprot:532985-Karenia_brevis.AAC.1
MDECFNKVKAHASSHGTNTKSSIERAMAISVEKGVLSEANRFKEIDWKTEVPERNVALPRRQGHHHPASSSSSSSILSCL